MKHDTPSTPTLDLEAVRTKLAAENGQRFWRSLDELAETPEFQDFLHREFPREASVWENGPSRRSFLKLAGASMALAGLGACARQPQEMIVPYVRQPEQLIPGKAMYFATALTLGGYASGALVKSHDGRPTKIEGNPVHPASLGSSDIYAQAAILTMYDPDRNKSITQVGTPRPWEDFVSAMQGALTDQEAERGAGLRILTPAVTSPTLADQIQSLLLNLPGATWHQYEAVNNDNVRAGALQAFGQHTDAIYHFDNADVVVSLDADFLYAGPGAVRYARDFAKKRSVGDERGTVSDSINRLYVVESTISVTGGMADHRLPVRPSQVEAVARALAGKMGVNVPQPDLDAVFENAAAIAEWVDAVAEDLQAHRGKAVVVPGREQPPIVHALAHAINGLTGSISANGESRAVSYVQPVEAQPVSHTESLRDLVEAMNAGSVDTLIIIGGNPVYSAPADLNFSESLRNVRVRVYHGLYFDETADRCHWVIPAAHDLESWSDARAYDGTTTIIQPLIEPLYGGKTPHEILAVLLGMPEKRSHDIVKDFWRGRFADEEGSAFEKFWRVALSQGVVSAEGRPSVAPPPRPIGRAPETAYANATYSAPVNNGLEVAIRPDPTIYDGRFANNGWLQEVPKPLSKITWENAILLAPSTAERLGLVVDEVAELTVGDVTVEGIVWAQPGQPRDSITIHLGYGRRKAGRIGDGIGFDVNAVRQSTAMWNAQGASVRGSGRRQRLARTEQHHSIDYGQMRGMKDAMDAAERRQLVRVAPVDAYHENPRFAQETSLDPKKSMYPPWEWDGHKWGMTIDLATCTGCNACIVACQAENNIPVVGRDEVNVGREMHWIRVDRYYRGEDLDNPEVYHQPLPCMQCEKAPCEVVCPAAATVHSEEGLNDMVYNRCVGTRYCSNNCPYKVRRFNFLHFSKLQYGGSDYESLKLMRNPNVTVRSRGVMEKCTFCVQRINAARIDAKRQGSDRIDEANLKTACQQACPSNAITFGDIADENSAVSVAKRSPRNYAILADLNTRPRTTYLAKVTNPNPRLVKG